MSEGPRRFPAVALLPLTLVFAALLAGGCGRERPPRLVLLTLDTLRYDSVAGPEPAMPRLAEWARGATRFESCWAAAPSTQPTHATLFTGLHPWQHGVTRNRLRLGEEHETVPERIRAAGFATAAVVASFPVTARFGFAQGFDRFTEELSRGRVGQRWRQASRRAASGEERRHAEGGYYELADRVVAGAVEALDTAPGGPQFFWFHLFDPHSPYGDASGAGDVRPREVMRRAARGEDPAPAVAEARRLYDLDVGELDRRLAQLLARLETDAERWETHVVVTADHGESFGEAGSMAHGRRLIPSQIRVPCLIRSPRLAPGPRADVAGSVDLAATLLALAGAGESAGGRDLSAGPHRRARAFGMRRGFDPPLEDRRLDGSVEVLDHRLYYTVTPDGRLLRGGGGELLAPWGEDADLSEAARGDLLALFAAFDDELQGAAAEAVTDPETERALRALGYVQ